MLCHTARLFALASILSALSTGCGPTSTGGAVKEAWNGLNNPGRLGIASARYQDVPTRGRAHADDGTLWSGDGWLTWVGGISYRWQSWTDGPTYSSFLFDVMTPAQAAALSEDQLAELSPAEKFDLYTGATDFPLTRKVKASVRGDVHGTDVPHWHGICHGWAAASTREPGPGAEAKVTLADGRQLIFYAGDLSALLAYSYSNVNAQRSAAIGGRCNDEHPARDANGRIIDSACRDVNPASLHLALGSIVGTQGGTFIVDGSATSEVWNYPVSGYAFQYSSPRPLTDEDATRSYRAPGTTKLVDVDLALELVDYADPDFVAVTRNPTTYRYKYSLELGANDMILGGEWTGDKRPDFLWRVLSAPGEGAPIDYAKVQALRDLSLH